MTIFLIDRDIRRTYMETAEKKDILEGITDVRERLKAAREQFNTDTDEALIDSCIYEIISLNARYKYYLHLAKEEGITAEGFK